MSLLSRISKMAKVLSDRGLDKEAREVVEIKDAMIGDMPDYSRGVSRPMLHGTKNRREHVPFDRDIKPYKEGDFVIELNPTTMKEELMMWDGRRLVPKKEIEDMVDKRIMREERIFDQYGKSSPEVKNQMKPLLEYVKSKRTFSNVPEGQVSVPYYPEEKLAQITKKLDKLGYTLLVKKLKTSMDEYSKSIS